MEGEQEEEEEEELTEPSKAVPVVPEVVEGEKRECDYCSQKHSWQPGRLLKQLQLHLHAM